MNPVLKFLFVSVLTMAFSLHDLDAAVRRFEAKEFYTNGKIKSVTITRVSTPRNIDLFNFYKETKIVKTEYDSITGNKIMHSVRITKVGIGGKHCYEYSSKLINYDANERRQYFEKSKCDKHKFMYKNYVNGKVSFIHIERKRRRN
jgi:hypothetical protein